MASDPRGRSSRGESSPTDDENPYQPPAAPLSDTGGEVGPGSGAILGRLLMALAGLFTGLMGLGMSGAIGYACVGLSREMRRVGAWPVLSNPLVLKVPIGVACAALYLGASTTFFRGRHRRGAVLTLIPLVLSLVMGWSK